jgi:DNA-binding NtrC family response regulator
MASARLLIVDDEVNVRSALRRSLRRTSHQLLFAESGKAALEILDREEVDIVMSDHLMPGMTGVQLLRAVRLRKPYVARIMLTGHADLDTAMDAVRSGDIDRFLTKPWDDVELRAVLEMTCEKLAAEAENRRLLAALRAEDVTRAGAAAGARGGGGGGKGGEGGGA